MTIVINDGVFVLELDYDDPATSGGSTGTLYLSSAGGTKEMTTGPSDTPANTVFAPRLLDPGNYERYLYRANTTGGESQAGRGDIVISNADGGLDAYVDYAYDDRALILRYGTPTGAYPGGLSTLFNGTALQALFSWDKITISLRDMQALVANKPMQSTTYAGTNSGTTGFEGLPGDIKGKFKPVLYGQCFNIPTPVVNSSSLSYQISEKPITSVDAVYDKGAALTAGTARATLAALAAGAPAASHYDYYLGTAGVDGAYLKLGSTPAGQITCDATQGAAAGDRTVAQIMRAIFTGPGGLIDYGVTGAQLDSTSFTALDSANSAVVGIWVDTAGQKVGNALDELARSIGAYWTQSRAGLIKVGRLTLPNTAPVISIQSYEIEDVIERVESGDPGAVIPVWRVQVDYKKNYQVQTQTDLAGGGATQARVAFTEEQFRSSIASNADVQTAHPLSQTMEVETLLTVEADASTEATRLQALYNSRREMLNVAVPRGLSMQVELGDVVTLTAARYDWNNGKHFVVIGMNERYAQPSDILVLWG